jgi:hypothetical protein
MSIVIVSIILSLVVGCGVYCFLSAIKYDRE